MFLTLAADPSDSQCQIADPGPNGNVTVHVLFESGATGPPGGGALLFAAPVPVASGLTHVSDSSPFYLSGNSQTGVDVAFGTCLVPSTPTLVMTMTFVRTSAGEPCTPYELASAPGFSPEVMNCHFDWEPIQVYDGIILNSDGTCDQSTDPSPSDGAEDVPLVTTLQWTPPYSCNTALHGDTEVYFGTSLDPPVVGYAESSFPVGPLEPTTTYYWKIWDNDAGQAGPLWSFTTANSVAAQQSTWGAIKALYR